MAHPAERGQIRHGGTPSAQRHWYNRGAAGLAAKGDGDLVYSGSSRYGQRLLLSGSALESVVR